MNEVLANVLVDVTVSEDGEVTVSAPYARQATADLITNNGFGEG